MNWKKMLFPALAALAAVALGFFLPDLVGIAQHRMMSRGSDKISTQNMQLHFAGMDFIEKLGEAYLKILFCETYSILEGLV